MNDTMKDTKGLIEAVRTAINTTEEIRTYWNGTETFMYIPAHTPTEFPQIIGKVEKYNKNRTPLVM